MVNKEYSDKVFDRQHLVTKREKTPQEKAVFKEQGDVLTKMEMDMSATDIVDSVKDAFKHIPTRE